MPTTDSLQADIDITLLLMGNAAVYGKSYPKNEWGIALLHYDVMIAWFGSARMESKEDSLRRNIINQENPDVSQSTQWDQWHEDNPNLFSIQYVPGFENAMKTSLAFCKEPPSSLRDCLELLANGHELAHEDLFVFTQMYADYNAAVQILFGWDDSADKDLARQRSARDSTTRERWRLHAAKKIDDIMESERSPTIAQARVIFALEVHNAIKTNSCPTGWTTKDYKKFLGKPDKYGQPKLKTPYGEKLTETVIKKLLSS